MEITASQIENEEQDISEDLDERITDISSLSVVHNRHQFESIFDFDLVTKSENIKKSYHVDMYFFIPHTMKIHGETYSRSDFYSDLVNYLRMRTPEGKIEVDDWSLPMVEKYLENHLMPYYRKRYHKAATHEVKLFACVFNNRMNQINHLFYHQRKSDEVWDEETIQDFKRHVSHTSQLLKKYRDKYACPVRQKVVITDAEIRKAVLLSDEYSSYRFESILVRFCRAWQKKHEQKELCRFLEEHLAEEMEYRSQAGIICLGGDTEETEYYCYRIGLLKKYVSNALFLKVQNVHKEKKYRNVIAAFGAAMAALAAGLSDVRHWQAAGYLSVRIYTIIFLSIIAYVFKDRIKDWTKEYFNNKLKHHLPDFDRQMFYTKFFPNGDSKEYFLGTFREYMRYLSVKSVPPDIAYVRSWHTHNELEPERQENVLHYSKKLRFEFQSLHEKEEDIRFIKAIVRFDFSKFLAKLDEPDKSIWFYDKKGGVRKMEAPRVYHINVVFRYGVQEAGEKRKVDLERIRIVLNKKGIVRIEKVINRGEMKFEEDLV